MLKISDDITIPESEVEITAIRAQGAGGQNVNKVATAIHLRFDARGSAALPEAVKARLAAMKDRRITSEGVIVIKAQQYRSREKNKEAAMARLAELVSSATRPRKPRKATKPTRASREKRLEGKTKRARLKASRGKIDPE